MKCVNIVGAGLAGLSAAITLAEKGYICNLISLQNSERAQSVLAEGGINAALDTMGENDTAAEHYEDTMRGGCYLQDADAVRGLTENAPSIVMWLKGLGVPFHLQDGNIVLRNFGGQKKKRTAYAKSSTGKVLVSALIDEVRKYENRGLIKRFPHHEFVELLLDSKTGYVTESDVCEADDGNPHIGKREAEDRESSNEEVIREEDGARIIVNFDSENRGSNRIKVVLRGAGQGEHDGLRCCGVRVYDRYSGELMDFHGTVILATGGMSGMFPGMTTGTAANTGDVTAKVFSQGVRLSNLEMIQYHPTTIGISGKRLLVTEAARGEGGRLCVKRNGQWWYFMEEIYPELKNLMPRDVVSREMYKVVRREDCEDQVYLDLTGLSEAVWKTKLPDMRQELMDYLGIDPVKEFVPVEPGIHYFMGGINVDVEHRTNIEDLYAAGECCSQYHGANRLGGNSLLGAVYGGRRAAESIIEIMASNTSVSSAEGTVLKVSEGSAEGMASKARDDSIEGAVLKADIVKELKRPVDDKPVYARSSFITKERDILLQGMGIVRNETELNSALEKLEGLSAEVISDAENNRLMLGEAMLKSALFRKESRGAHFREDYSECDDSCKKLIIAGIHNGRVEINYKK